MARQRPERSLKQRICRRGICVILLGLVSYAPNSLHADPPAEKPKLVFEEQILPILKTRCIKCHAGAEPSGGLRLTTRSDLLRGGSAGPAIRIAAAESSLIWEKLTSNEMPKGGPPLSADEKGIIRAWINEGALSSAPDTSDSDPLNESLDNDSHEHWSFRPPVKPPVPSRAAIDADENPIDAFIIHSLQAKGLTLSSRASRAVLLRRASYDLIGLPPSPEDVREFMSDPDEFAYERWIDRLLESPHYGERWGRHWLDLAGYADSAGVLSEDRPLPTAFRYRDYVIRAFNRDKPYDQFLREQIAGDELVDYWSAYEKYEVLPDEVIEAITATGYLRCAADSSRPDFSTIKNADAQYYYPTINDTLQIVASSTMGVTLQCARCHSHKFDPIAQSEYYQLQSIFMGALRPREWIAQMDRKLLIASAAQKRTADEHNGKLDAEIARLKKELSDLRTEFKQQHFDRRLNELPEVLRADVKSAFGKPADQRTDVDKYFVEKLQVTLQPDDKSLDQLLPEAYPDYKAAAAARNEGIAQQERRRMHFDEVRALYDLPGPVVTHLLRRGDALTPGPVVEPGVLKALTTPVSFQWTAPAPEAKTSGRRLAFANWLTQPDHPLTSRVLVNRVWLHHFGEGIVATPEDFGTLGATPSHPQLLDWLAREFVDSGWSMKRLHRLMMTSKTYCQRSIVDDVHHANALAADPDNRLMWRQRMRRLDAEPLRDAMLCVSGLLDRQVYGRAIPVARRPDGDVTIADGNNEYRRSIYVQVLRGNPLTLLHAHDQPVMETNCTRRSRSTVSTQALTLLNSDACQMYAQAFSDRALRESVEAPLNYVALVAWSRDATSVELRLFEEFVKSQQMRHVSSGEPLDQARRKAFIDLCHMVMASNEFVHVD
ncbi:PSD1 and planctomycete cytochrome C domain-containing protein [Schlesneria paludicola]|uniref:PSD1 and planctomycete cytochrome C domain-containing protein n=1 Tax=Schlesneria paludicola TaxID=360056 RepID=UPI00067FAE66|nr:PSD1 and planctomycete cytochrome C domain-containing protein [Schlesneria paludicola]